jgi:uncharacterized damage-inducible protein DinB
MDPKNIIELYQYNQWANKRVLDACATLTEEQFTRGMGNSFPSVRDTLAHILGAEFAWYERLFGRYPTALLSGADFPALAPLLRKFEEHDARLLDYVSKLSAADLDKVLEYKNLSGKELSNPLWQIFQHLANHGTYHRGQVTTMFRQLGAKPVSTDLIGFYREQAERAHA